MTQNVANAAAAPQKLWNKNFLIWWLGGAQSALGSALASIATSFLVLHQTGSAGAMGLNLALALLPALLSPFLGTLIDRLPIKPPLILGNLLRSALQLGMGFWALRGHVPTEAIYAASFLTGLVGAFYGPAAMGVTPRLVPPDQLERAAGLMQGTSQSMNMVGMIGGGFLVATVGKAQALIFDGVSFFIFAALLAFVTFPARNPRAQQEKFWTAFGSGLNYVKGSAVLVGLPLLALVLNAAFAPLEMLMPKRMVALGAGSGGFGLFFGMLLAGMALGSFLIASLGKKVKPTTASVFGMLGMGLSMLALAFSTTPLQMYVLAALSGFANAFCNMGIGVIFQKRVDPEYFGRVGSLLNLVGMVGMPLTLLALAPVADRISVTTIFAMAGGLTIVGALLWQLILRREPVNLSAPEAMA